MLVSESTFMIVVVVIIVLIAIYPLYSRFVKKQGKKHSYFFLLLILLIPFNWYTPTVYTINGCDDFTKQVLLLPTEKEGVKLEMGQYNYVFNNSNESIIFEHIYYGSNNPKEDEIDVEIIPNSVEKLNVVTVDYLFNEPPSSVSTKSKGETKTTLYCLE